MSAATDTQVESAQQWDTLQRVILPNASQMDTVPLYMDMGTATGIQLPTVGRPRTARRPSHRSFSSASQGSPRRGLPVPQLHQVRSGERVSFGTYFNAFPASYWRRWTIGGRRPASGRGPRAPARSSSTSPTPADPLQRVDTQARRRRRRTNTFELSLAPFGDGGWYWFDLAAGSERAGHGRRRMAGPPRLTSTPGSVTLRNHDAEQDRLLPEQPPASWRRTPTPSSTSRKS